MIPPTLRPSGHDQSQPTSVYVLLCAGRVKIGIAADVAARMAALQLASPLEITVAHVRQFETRTVARLVERSLHSQFGESRLHGEWFTLEAAAAIAALQAVEEPPAPVKITGRFRHKERPDRQERAERARAPIHTDKEGPTFAEMDEMDDDTWTDFMRPLAQSLAFDDPDAYSKMDVMEQELREKYPQYYRPRLVAPDR